MVRNATFGNKVRRWVQSPGFYFRRAIRRTLGENLSFLKDSKEQYPPGSYEWLVLSEASYGGIQLSVKDRERKLGIQTNGVQGGDRMTPFYHDYGRCYSEFLRPFVASVEQPTILEVGILNGSGLAIWCDLFRNSRVVGFDIDLENFEKNYQNLTDAGAFSHCKPETHWFDQFDVAKSSVVLQNLFPNGGIGVVIDDGCHTVESIELTFQMIEPFLAKNFVYFIEDSYATYEHMVVIRRDYRWTSRGQLTVCRPRTD